MTLLSGRGLLIRGLGCPIIKAQDLFRVDRVVGRKDPSDCGILGPRALIFWCLDRLKKRSYAGP